jgi:hypothetical protein
MYRKRKGERFEFVTSPNTVFICIDLVGLQERHSLTFPHIEAVVDGTHKYKVYFVNVVVTLVHPTTAVCNHSADTAQRISLLCVHDLWLSVR